MINLKTTNHERLYSEDRGQLEKYWVKLDNAIFLFKANYRTPDFFSKTNFGEVLYSRLAKKFGIDCVDAQLAFGLINGNECEGTLIKSFLKNQMQDQMSYQALFDFTKKMDTSRWNIKDKIIVTCPSLDVESCIETVKNTAEILFRKVDLDKIRKDLCKMVVLDYFLAQSDRHARNIEFIFDEQDNIFMAPMFDNGFCLSFTMIEPLAKYYLTSERIVDAKQSFMGNVNLFSISKIDGTQLSEKEFTNQLVNDIILISKQDKDIKKLIDGLMKIDIKKEINGIVNENNVQIEDCYVTLAEIIYENRKKNFDKLYNETLVENDEFSSCIKRTQEKNVDNGQDF